MEKKKVFTFYNDWSRVTVEVQKTNDYVTVTLKEAHKAQANYQQGEIYYDTVMTITTPTYDLDYFEYGSGNAYFRYILRRLEPFLRQEQLKDIYDYITSD